jgi:hypothetical protein
MPSFSNTYTFTNGDVIDATQVMTNFADNKTYFNTYAVQTDGTVQATTASLADGIVTTAKIANLGVTTAKLADSSVTSAKIVDDTIVNADINSAAAIVDTKLATIATAGKVSNSATTATNANTASAIVARDASGNFSAGTITATLSGNASTSSSCSGNAATATNVAYSGLTGGVPTWNQNTTGNAATATNVAQSGITGMKQLSSTTTMYNSNGSFAIAHGIGTTPSNVIAVNGDYGAHAQALTLTTADGTYIYGKMLNTTANIAIRVNWIAFW